MGANQAPGFLGLSHPLAADSGNIAASCSAVRNKVRSEAGTSQVREDTDRKCKARPFRRRRQR